MAVGSQCGEDAIFAEFFGSKTDGFVVDVGAADGQDNSNSWALIQKGWHGILIEPDEEQYDELADRYSSNSKVITMNKAAGTDTGIKPFYHCRQVSTFSSEWRDKCVATYGVTYRQSMVTILTLQFILGTLGCPKEFDLLTIDCEALDDSVLSSLDLTVFKPTLICMECPLKTPEGYEVLTRTSGNTIYRRL